MAGEAKTNAFLLGSASVMIGPTNKLWELQPSTHSIGLVKNVRANSEASYTELKQGTKQQIVYSVQTDNPTKITAEVYEYTGSNLAYALGLDGSGYTTKTGFDLTLKTAITTGGTSVVANAATDPGIAAGDWIMIQDTTNNDKAHVAQVASATFATATVTITLTAATAMPTTGPGATWNVGSRVQEVNSIDVGAQVAQPYFSCKILGALPENNQPVAMLFPKVRITKGFDLGFVTDNFGNMPFEITPYQLTASDPNYALFSSQLGRVMTAF